MTTDLVKYEDKVPAAPVNEYEFSENNSGGSFWLSSKQYDALLADGFYVRAPTEDWEIERYGKTGLDGPFSDSLKQGEIPYWFRHNLRVKATSLREAVERWEAATGEDFFAEGCNCCGCPFSASAVSGDEYASGDSVIRETIRPW